VPDAAISPTQEGVEYRIVLSWGETPGDLDAHLTFPTPDADGRFHLYWARLGSYGGSNPYSDYANLDRDDVTSFGPETITISQLVDGVFRYSVHDYSNRGSTSSMALANSGAQVELYRGNTKINTFNVPSGRGGTLWTVFEIENDEVNAINEMSYVSDPASVQRLSVSVDASLFRNLPAKR
jgi:uncharacterized protein YfaP (DUF2135 family)